MPSKENVIKENQLWQKMRLGDSAALLELYKSFYPSLFSKGFCLCLDRQLTKDLIHELFLQLWTDRKRISYITDIGTYLQERLQKNIIDVLKKGLLLEEEVYSMSYGQEYPYEEVLIAFQTERETQKKLDIALLQLTKKQIEVIRLRFREHKSYEEIAQLTGRELSAMYAAGYEAIRHLRYHLSKISI